MSDHVHYGCPSCRAVLLREQQVDALRSIANSLEILTQAMAVDDSGLAGLRIVGEITGGDGDVREPA